MNLCIYEIGVHYILFFPFSSRVSSIYQFPPRSRSLLHSKKSEQLLSICLIFYFKSRTLEILFFLKFCCFALYWQFPPDGLVLACGLIPKDLFYFQIVQGSYIPRSSRQVLQFNLLATQHSQNPSKQVYTLLELPVPTSTTIFYRKKLGQCNTPMLTILGESPLTSHLRYGSVFEIEASKRNKQPDTKCSCSKNHL